MTKPNAPTLRRRATEKREREAIKATALLRRMVDVDPCVETRLYGHVCFFCGAGMTLHVSHGLPQEHAEDCLWALARELFGVKGAPIDPS